MPHAFISYVKEDGHIAEYLAELLKQNGLDVWIDKEALMPGARWKDAIRDAINEGAYFIPLFTQRWADREKTVANEELLLAIEQLRIRPRNKSWFIPLKVDDCILPNHPIGGGEYLSDLQYIDIPQRGWRSSLLELLKALGVENPSLNIGEPLAPGLSSAVELTAGEIVYENTRPLIPNLKGLIFPVVGGACGRTKENAIIATIRTRAPNIHLQNINKTLGLDLFYAESRADYISSSSQRPTEFSFWRKLSIPANTPFFDMTNGQTTRYPFDIPVSNRFHAYGYFIDWRFKGTFDAEMILSFDQVQFPIALNGSFDIGFVNYAGPFPPLDD